MNQKDTRQSNTQKVVTKNKSHSRGFLSRIFNACRCKKENTLLNKYVEDPRLQTSGMTALCNFPSPVLRTSFPMRGKVACVSTGMRGKRFGFTLIELLVVVLIIGLLAAIAVPRYQKIIDTLRITRALEMSKNLAYAETVYYLSNGTYTKDLSKLDVDLGECTCTNTPCTRWNCGGYSVWISDMGTFIRLDESWTGGQIISIEYYLVERKKGWRVGYAATERFQNIWTKLGGVPMNNNPGYFRLSGNW